MTPPSKAAYWISGHPAGTAAGGGEAGLFLLLRGNLVWSELVSDLQGTAGSEGSTPEVRAPLFAEQTVLAAPAPWTQAA